MAIQLSEQNVSPCLDDPNESFGVESSASDPSIPRRNLTGAFDDLYVDNAASAGTPAAKQAADNMISPTGVMDVVNLGLGGQTTSECMDSDTPYFYLHPDLKRDLSQALVNRVSIYEVIHDINKEAKAMASNDESSFHRVTSMDDDEYDDVSPLVLAVNGSPFRACSRGPIVDSCLIDEERWLLTAVEFRGDDECRTIASCPATFAQAIGEREYEDTQSTLENSRTQLWKPSRSWWEAKSGKNPWIEPKSHNKRWRYLWPLIHYHKFLAKCIKKLKRNSVDVKVSVSPVAVFLREEVCAVSDHLASVSNFGSDEWMECLTTFNGWIGNDERTEARMRSLILKMNLRSMDDPGDVDSPLLRSQVDDQFLRSMVTIREQMAYNNCPRLPKQTKITKKKVDAPLSTTTATSQSTRPGLPLHPKTRQAGFPPSHSKNSRNSLPGQRTRYAASTAPSSSTVGAQHCSKVEGSHMARQSKYGYYWPGWTPQYAFCDDGTSVESALSGDSYQYQYPGQEYGMYPPHCYYQYPPNLLITPDPSLSHSENGSYPTMGSHDGSFYPTSTQYHPDQNMMVNGCWYPPIGDPGFAFGPAQMEGAPVASCHSMASPSSSGALGVQSAHPPNSPHWGHLDYNTLAIAGIMTPHGTPKGKASPSTPCRLPLKEDSNEARMKSQHLEKNDIVPQTQYYPSPGFFFGAQEGYAPPSPATQFMMPPQVNSQAAACYAYNFQNYYYASPHRHGSRRKSPRKSPPRASALKDEHLQKVEENRAQVNVSAIIRKLTESIGERTSPVTIETETESVSAEEEESAMAHVQVILSLPEKGNEQTKL